MANPVGPTSLAPPRSALVQLIALELGIAVVFILGFASFLFDRLDYVLERRDRQIVTRELDRIAYADDAEKVRRYFADLKETDRRITPDIIYAFVSNLDDCPPSAPLRRCAEEMLWTSAEVQQETIDFINLAGPRPERQQAQPEPEGSSGPVALRPTTEFLTNRAYYQARSIGTDGLLLVGIDRTEILEEGRGLLVRSTIVFAAFVILATLIAAWFITRMKQRIVKMNATLERVGSGSLHERVSLTGKHDELDTLGRHTNAMIDRLEGLVTSLQRLSKQLERRNEFIRETFGRYLTDEVVTTLLESPTGLHIGGEKRKITMMMADLRGFTSLSERLGPERVVAILNRFLSAMVKIIDRYKGTTDEFIGDAIFVLFGAPIHRDDDAERAVACALEMQLAMESVNEQNQREGLPEIEMGIGIHTGEVVVGNIGSLERMKYGVVGSQVNFTSRIQSYSIGGQILVSEATRKELGEFLRIGRRTKIRAKGIEGPVALFEVLGIESEHRLSLSQQPDRLVPLMEEIQFRYTAAQEAQLTGETSKGSLTKLSAKQAEVRLGKAIPILSDLRIQLIGRDGREIPGSLYGKVLRKVGRGLNFHLRFTSISPESEAFLASRLKAQVGETPPASSS